MDIKTVHRRVEHEGLSFLTITLPDLGKFTQKWIDQGHVGINSAFKTGRGRLPVFLQGFFSQVFDRSTGVLLDNPNIEAIRSLRQLTLMFGKIALPCTPAREHKAMLNFVKCEKEVRQSDMKLTENDFQEFQRISDMLFRGVFTQMDRDVYYGELLPKHGPGSVADKLTANGKFKLRTWTRRLEEVFPSHEYLIPNHHFSDELDQVSFLEPGSEMPVKVISVPKTLKTPRIIAIEPACMQYTQQALLRSFLSAYERDELLSRLIGFDDQVPNQDLARQGSVDNRTATLDLSDASDRVSNQLVRRMVSRWPHLHKAFDATRSRRADVKDIGVIRLSKYASMGSALCFPVEAMVFTTLIFLGIQKSLNTTLTRKDVAFFADSVRVFGDDLIVPVEHVSMIIRTLEHFGARVGQDKSFWTGRFRESCGKEFYDGEDVSIVRVRQELPSVITDATGVIATVSLRNQLYQHGYWRTVAWLDTWLKGMLKHYPTVAPTSPVLGRVSFLGYQTQRMHPSLHSPQVRGYVVQAKAPSDKLDGTGALLKCLLKLESENRENPVRHYADEIPCYRPGTIRENGSSSWAPPESQDEKHLERSGRPKRVGTKLGWWPSY
jgi:hypothetical protein